jgi:hypothetical protein
MNEEQRSAFLENLAAGFPLPRALSHACGGKVPVKAWKALGEMRRTGGAAYDAEVAAACEAVERKAKDEGPGPKPEPFAFVASPMGTARDDSGLVPVQVTAPIPALLTGPDGGEHPTPATTHAQGPRAVAPLSGLRALAAQLAPQPKPSPPEKPQPPPKPAAPTQSTEVRDAAESVTGWDRVRREALALGDPSDPELYRYLLWVEGRAMAFGMHALDPSWKRHFRAFYSSGKFVDVGRFGVRAAKSDSVMYAIMGEVLLNLRSLQADKTGVCPIMSSNMREAGDRFDTAKALLRAVGFRDLTGSKAAVEPRSFKASGGGNAALVIELLDSQDHPVEFRVYPASEAGAAGFTGIAGFGDELDLWGKATGANPASKVLRVLRSRYTTQPEAKLHLMSATYDRESEHAQLIKNGDTMGQYVARLGIEGAAYDFEQRMRLAKLIDSKDPMLCGPMLPPSCADIPCWVTNPITPIEEAYAKADGDLRIMFALFGGRLEASGGGGGAAQCIYAARVTAALSDRMNGRTRIASPDYVEPMKIKGARPGDARYDGREIGRAQPRVDWRQRKAF